MHMTDKDRLDYAELLLSGCNPRPGQNLLISGEPEHWPLMLAVAEAAYKQDIRYVDVQSFPGALTRVRALHSREAYLPYQPASRMSYFDSLVEEEWALISLHGAEKPDILADVPTGALGILTDGNSRVRTRFRDALRRDQLNWLVAAAPTAGWARKVLGVEGTVEALWKILTPILRLDASDPAAAWWAHQDALTHRAALLTELQPVSLRFFGGGTDLTVTMNPRHIWMGGGATSAKGRRFTPNLPTEEVFTTPGPGSSGVVELTRPAVILGQVVEDAVLTFKDGVVVEATARKNLRTLETFLSLDEGSSRMGEIALVDGRSPVSQAKTVFFDTLLDENAACHLALGFGYPDGVEGGLEADEKTLAKRGVNLSRYHMDVMFGHDKLDVEARLADGTTRPIMKQGCFLDPF